MELCSVTKISIPFDPQTPLLSLYPKEIFNKNKVSINAKIF